LLHLQTTWRSRATGVAHPHGLPPHNFNHRARIPNVSLLASLYKTIGKYTKAEPLYKEALEIRLKVLGPEHPLTAASQNSLAMLYEAIGDYPRAEPLFKKALETRQKVLGRENPTTAESLNNLAELYRAVGDYAKAEALLKEALEIYQKVVAGSIPIR
jgi:tetratricopeptide (TPR) repeat protein